MATTRASRHRFTRAKRSASRVATLIVAAVLSHLRAVERPAAWRAQNGNRRLPGGYLTTQENNLRL